MKGTIQEQVYMALGKFVREKRAGENVNQKTLSDLTGVSMRAISTIENNKAISDANVEKLLLHFGFTAVVAVLFKPSIPLEEEE